uniref:(northern house mosquito) hypothetical protein n=1 Tax=Culex pipiens TaxID=7175 RepID=A0A8D8BQ65_CULPI
MYRSRRTRRSFWTRLPTTSRSSGMIRKTTSPSRPGTIVMTSSLRTTLAGWTIRPRCACCSGSWGCRNTSGTRATYCRKQLSFSRSRIPWQSLRHCSVRPNR